MYSVSVNNIELKKLKLHNIRLRIKLGFIQPNKLACIRWMTWMYIFDVWNTFAKKSAMFSLKSIRTQNKR